MHFFGGGAVNRNNISDSFIFLFFFYTPQHVLVLMGHLQKEYTQVLIEAITPTTDPF
jgi:hypothetical protein